jgi:outer membrane protein TolC
MSQVKESMDDVAGKYGAVIVKELGLSEMVQEEVYNKIVNGLGKLPAYNIEIDQQHFPNLNIYAVQPVFTGGKIIAGRKASEAEYQLSQLDFEEISNKVLKEVVTRYLQVAMLKEVVITRQEVVDGIMQHEKDASRAVEIGMIPPHELLRAQVAVATAQRERDDDINKLELATLALATAIGMDSRLQLNLTDALVYRLAYLSLDSLTANAKANQTIFRMIDQKQILIEQKIAFNRSGFLPQIAAFGQYGIFRDQYPVIMPPFILGIQLNMKIFGGLKEMNTYKSSLHLQNQLNFAREYAVKEVNLWVNKAYTDVVNYQERYQKLKPTVDLAKKNLEINQKRFREGVGKSIDVIDAEMLFSGAKTERLYSLYQYYEALTELYLATGKPEKVVDVLME